MKLALKDSLKNLCKNYPRLFSMILTPVHNERVPKSKIYNKTNGKHKRIATNERYINKNCLIKIDPLPLIQPWQLLKTYPELEPEIQHQNN